MSVNFDLLLQTCMAICNANWLAIAMYTIDGYPASNVLQLAS